MALSKIIEYKDTGCKDTGCKDTGCKDTGCRHIAFRDKVNYFTSHDKRLG